MINLIKKMKININIITKMKKKLYRNFNKKKKNKLEIY